MKDYRLRFDDEQQANDVIGQVTNDLHLVSTLDTT